MEERTQISVRPKRNGLRIFILQLVASLFLGCATAQNFEGHYSAWIGQDESRLVDAWGKPAREISLPNGNTEYAYNLFREPPPATGCVIYFEVGKESRKIIRLRSYNFKEGRPCKRAPSFV